MQRLKSSQIKGFREVFTSLTMVSTEDLSVSGHLSNITITLPTGIHGDNFKIYKPDPWYFDVSLSAPTGLTVNGAASYTLPKNQDNLWHLIRVASDWRVVPLVSSTQYDATGFDTLSSSISLGASFTYDPNYNFNNTSNIFYLTPAGSQTVYVGGKTFVKTSTEQVTLTNTGISSIYYNSSGVLSAKSSSFDFSQDATVSIVYRNIAGNLIYLAEERHSYDLSWTAHEYLHNTRGAAYASGFGITDFNTSGDGSLLSHCTIGLNDGSIYDEDIEINITHNASGGYFQMPLAVTAKLPILYKSGFSWSMLKAGDAPLSSLSGGRMIYNVDQGGMSGWGTTEIQNNYFGVMFIVATNNILAPICAIMGQHSYGQKGAAEASLYGDLDLSYLPIAEFRPLYKLVYETANSFSNTYKSRLVAINDLRRTDYSGMGTPAVPSGDHGLLGGLYDDDHPHYLTEPRGDARYPLMVFTNTTNPNTSTIFNKDPASTTHDATSIKVKRAIYVSSDLKAWIWSSSQNTYLPLSASAKVTISDLAPTTPAPAPGDLWYNSLTLDLLIYYSDGVSSAWISTSGGSGGSGLAIISPSAPASPADGTLWYDISSNVFNVWDGSAWRPAGLSEGVPRLYTSVIGETLAVGDVIIHPTTGCMYSCVLSHIAGSSFDPAKFQQFYGSPRVEDLLYPGGIDDGGFEATTLSSCVDSVAPYIVCSMLNGFPTTISGTWTGPSTSFITGTSAISGTTSLRISFPNTAVGQGVALRRRSVDSSFKGKIISLSLLYANSSTIAVTGNSSNSLGIFLYDYTNSVVLNPLQNPFSMNGTGTSSLPREISNLQFFVPTNCSSIGLIFVCTTAFLAGTLDLDNIQTRKMVSNFGSAVIDLGDFTQQFATIGGTAPVLPTTTIVNKASAIRKGSTVDIEWDLSYSSGTGGATGTGSLYVFTLPYGLKFDMTKYVGYVTGSAFRSKIGTISLYGTSGAQNAIGDVFVYDETRWAVYARDWSGNWFNWSPSSSYFALSFGSWFVSIQNAYIAGWSASTAMSSSLQMNNDYAGWQQTSINLGNSSAFISDTTRPGWYYKDVTFPFGYSPNVTTSVNVYSLTNGSTDTFTYRYSSTNLGMRLWVYRTDSPGAGWGNAITASYYVFPQQAVFPTLATEPTVAAKYFNTIGSAVVGGVTPLVFNTQTSLLSASHDLGFDTHLMVNTSNGVITIPVNGIYEVSGHLRFNDVGNQLITLEAILQKNVAGTWTVIAYMSERDYTGTRPSITFSNPVKMLANEQYRIVLYSNLALTMSTSRTWMSIRRLGAF